MISIIKTDVIKNKENGEVITGELRGKSTDTKPTTIDGKTIGNGSAFIEIDTGKVYLFDGETQEWNEV